MGETVREVDKKTSAGDVGGGDVGELGPVGYVVFGSNLTCFLCTALLYLPYTPSSTETHTSVTVLYYVYIQPTFSSRTLRETSGQAMQVQSITFLNYTSLSSSCLISSLPSQAPPKRLIYYLQGKK